MTLAVAFAGCATQGQDPGCGILAIPGKISFTKDGSSGSSLCSIGATYTNLSQYLVKPELEYIAFDNNGNTLEEGFVWFDTILPGKSQTKTMYITGNCNKLKVVNIKSASFANRLICGVHKTVYTFH